MKATRVTNPLGLGRIAPRINDLCNKVKIEGITYESLYTHFAQSIQLGGDRTEFWVVFDEGKPQAFAHWVVRSLPYIGTVYLEWIYKWVSKHEPVEVLLEKFRDFGERHNSPIYEADAYNEKVWGAFEKTCTSIGYSLTRRNRINGFARKI